MKHLSPTTFIKFLNCEHQVKLIKIDEVISDERDQSLAMATGTAFDIMVKGALNKKIDVPYELEKEILPKNQSCLLVAKELFDCYQKSALQELKKEGIGYGSVDQTIELEWEEPISGGACAFCGVKKGEYHKAICNSEESLIYEGTKRLRKSILNGRPDLTLSDGTVIDWKCQGMYGRGTEPKPGYLRCFIFGANHPQNGKCITSNHEISLPEVDRNWAIQLYLYARLLGHPVGRSLRGGIENICVDAKNVVYCASYRNIIPIEFQLDIEKKFHDAWEALITKKTKPPNYHKSRCVQYNKLCPVADFCSSYKEQETGMHHNGPSLFGYLK